MRFPDSGVGILSEDDQRRLRDLEEQLERAQKEAFAKAPQHVRALGPILRRSAETDSVVRFRRFCQAHGVYVPRRLLPLLRDYLVLQRFDLKDLEPAARERLRKHTLAGEARSNMTTDYREGQLRGDELRCRDCKFFVTPPNDDPADPRSAKSCVDLGTKGADQACYGFTRSN